MCGISGYWAGGGAAASAPAAAVVRRMAGALRHRGPDDEGAWCDEGAGLALGHRRLAILDLSPLGRQPMVSASGRTVLAFNGEIFNFAELRRELEAAGLAFRSRTDSEVLLEGIERWGVAGALERVEGMFAFAAWDRRARALTLARDRAGKKPLYYGWAGPDLVLASELKALHEVPGFAGEVDREALGLFLQYGWVPAPRTIHRDVRQLPPGTFLTLRRPGGARDARPEPYWDARASCAAGAAAPFAGGFEAATDRLEAVLGDAVARRMVADVPLGALLSGGIDSSTVVALMQSRSPRPVRTFTIGFEEASHDEAPHARAVAAHLGTEHAELRMTAADALALVPRLAELYDEPFADSSMLPTALVCRLARREVTVALSGDGGDELFAGYAYYAQAERRWQRLAGRSLARRRLEASCLAALGGSLWALGRGRGPAFAAGLAREAHALRARDLIDHHVRRRRQNLGDPAGLVLGGALAASTADEPALRLGGGEALRAVRLVDFVTWLPDDLLVKIDRASMAVGLEVRCPILDRAVVDLAWTLPDALLVGPGGGKRILKAVLARHVPPALTERPKGGFDVPLRAWLTGPLRGWAEALLEPARLRGEGYLRPEAVARLWRQFRAGWGDGGGHRLIWAVLMFQLWRERWGAPRPAPARAAAA